MRALALAASLAVLAGCDFTPALDVDVPEFQPGLALGAVLTADSTVVVGVALARDPYAPRPYTRPEIAGLTVTVARAGDAPETLTPSLCAPPPYEPGPARDCGRFVGQTVVQPGATYTVRATAPGLPAAEATVAVPARPAVTSTTPWAPGDTEAEVRLTLDDPPGEHRYALAVTHRARYETEVYDPQTGLPTGDRQTQDVSYWSPYQTTHPTLLAASAPTGTPGEAGLIVFDDRTFAGARLTADLTVSVLLFGPETEYPDGPPRAVVYGLSPELADAYAARYLTLGGADNPFVEPGNAASNVRGGYGLVGAIAASEP